jgi:hypothetical protein
MKIYSTDPTVKRAALAAFPSYNGRSFAVDSFPAHGMALNSAWFEGSRDSFTLINLSTLARMEIPQNGTPFDGGALKLSTLPEGAAVVKHTVFCGKDLGLTVFVNPADLAPMLPPAVDLTWAEKVVLVATKGLKAFARYQSALDETGITPDEYRIAREGLAAKRLLNAAGAITGEGRNVASTLPRLEDLDKPEHGGKNLDRWGIRRRAAMEATQPAALPQ